MSTPATVQHKLNPLPVGPMTGWVKNDAWGPRQKSGTIDTLRKAPPKGYIELIKKRAYEFAKRKKIEITAFRFVQEETVVTSTDSWGPSED